MTDMTFIHDTLPQRVAMGRGGAAARLAAEVDRRGATRVMLIAGERESHLADAVAADIDVHLRWDEVIEHVPLELAERARAAASDVDLLVTVGGGSTTGLGKAVALTSGVPLVAVPTTYAGSEATPVWGLTNEGHKRTGTDSRVLPVAVIYDSALTDSLPVSLSVASGLNALAHCVDSLWAPRADPINEALALEGARALAEGLPAVVEENTEGPGRDQMLYGSYLAAIAFGSAGSGMHHKICHVLGGAFNLPHAQTHAVVLPHVLAHNAAGVPDLAARLARSLGGADGVTASDPARAATAALEDLRRRLDAPAALRDHGLREQDIDRAVELALDAVPDSNPVPVTRHSLSTLLHAAWAGEQPTPRDEDA